MAYSPRTNDFIVNTSTAGDQTQPDVIVLADGRYLVVWGSPTTAQNQNFLIRGQFYAADGTPIGTEINLTTTTIRGQFEVSATALPGGGFALSWARGTSTGSTTEIQFFSAAGAQTSMLLTLDGSGRQPALDTMANGDVVAVWGDGDFNTGIIDVRGAIVSPAGTAQSFIIPTDGTGIRGEPDVTVLSNGNFVVSWTESDADLAEPATGANRFGIKAQLFAPDGTAVGAPILVNTTTADLQEQPELTALAGGGFVAVWTDSSASGGDASGKAVRGQVFDAAGNKVGGEFLVNTTVTDDQGEPKVTATEDGGFFVTWSDASASGVGTERDIRSQRFAANGTKVGAEVLVNTVTAGDQSGPVLTMNAAGDIFFAWTDRGVGDGSGGAVRGRVYTAALQGSNGAETLVGTPGSDEILANGGNDTVLVQQGGNDIVKGGDGDDIIYFGPAFTPADRVDGGAGRDILALQGVYPLQVLDAASVVNIEVLSLMTATDNAFGGATNTPTSYAIQTNDGNVAAGQALTVEGRALQPGETINFNGQAETDGKFALYGGRGNDTLLAGAGNDLLDGGAGTDTLNGGLGDDIYFVDQSGDVVQDTGPGFDAVYTSVSYTLAAPAEIELLATTASGSTVGVRLFGNGFSQTIIGTNGDDVLNGGDGNDYLVGNAGNDTLYATGNSVLAGGAGDDFYFVSDWFQVLNESAGQGYDRVFVQSSFVLLGDVEVEELNFEGSAGGGGVAFYGNGFAQILQGSSLSDELYGFGGNDTLVGFAGNDTLDGGVGADAMEGGAGDDIYFVDNAGDVVNDNGLSSDYNSVYASASFALSSGAFVTLLATTNSAGTDAIDLTGSSFAQTMIGNNGANSLFGLGGNDFIQGLGGADILDGGAGDDILEGGAGADTFRFSATADTVVSSGDQIRDFASGTDKIDLSLIDANTGTAGDQAFTYIGTGAFTGQAGQLRHEVANGQIYISGDTNGDGLADFQIVLNNTTIVAAGDFIY